MRQRKIFTVTLLLVAGLAGSLFLSPARATPRTATADPGHKLRGNKGEFFVTAAGNNPYISFHRRGNATDEGVFRLKFEKLIFFTDDGDGKYSPKDDTDTSTVGLTTLTWATGALTEGEGEFTIALNATSGIFKEMRIVIHYHNETANDQSHQVKIDIVITEMTDAAYAGGDHVALKHQLFIDYHGKHHKEKMQFRNGTQSVGAASPDTNQTEAEYKWDGAATINGTAKNKAVNGSTADESSQHTSVETVYLAFPRFENLTYDPTLTLYSASGISGYPIELVAGMALAGGCIAAVMASRKVKRKRLT